MKSSTVIPPPGMPPPPPARSSTCTRTSCSNTTALISRQQHSQRRHPRRRWCCCHAGANPQPQHAGSQDNDNGKLVLPQLNHLHEAFKQSQVPPRRLSALRTSSPLGPSQFSLTQPLSKHWHQFKAWSQHYAGKPFEKQHQLHLPQKHKATIPESTLGVEMN